MEKDDHVEAEGMTIEDVMMRNQVLNMRNRELQKRIDELGAEVARLETENKRFGRRISSAHIVLYDYDGYYNSDTRSGNVEGLASIVKEASEILAGSEDRDAAERGMGLDG